MNPVYIFEDARNSIIVGSASWIPVRLIPTKSNMMPGEQGSPLDVCAVLWERSDRLLHQIPSQQPLPSLHWFISKSSRLQQPDGETSWVYNRERGREGEGAGPAAPAQLSERPQQLSSPRGGRCRDDRQMPGNIWRADAAESHTVRRKGEGEWRRRVHSTFTFKTLKAKVTLWYSAVST